MLDRHHGSRLRRAGRRTVRRIRRSLERTTTLVHVSILLFVPALIGLLTALSFRVESLSFFLLPPLAAGTYALFARPESDYASPVRFVAGLTTGAVCAWIAMEFAIRIVYPDMPPTAIRVDAPGAAFAVFLTGLVTWALDVEEAAAFSMALLGLLVEPGQQFPFVLSVFVASSIVAAVFSVWRDRFYERRADYLYGSTRGDDHVLVPMRGEFSEAAAVLGGRLAAAHDAGKVILLDVADGDDAADAKRTALSDGSDRSRPGSRSRTRGPGAPAASRSGTPVAGEAGVDSGEGEVDPAITETVGALEDLAGRIESDLDVPCRVIVAAGGPSPAETVEQVARETDCDLVVTPYEAEDGELTTFATRLLNATVDTLVHRSSDGRTTWRRIVVPVRKPGDTAHNMLDFARRLAGEAGQVSVAHCIRSERQRRTADEMLANLAETLDGNVETRVSNSSIEEFLVRVAPENDLVIIGASRDRSVASRLVSPPTFERIDELDSDLAIVARG